jgi:hypothetical protein
VRYCAKQHMIGLVGTDGAFADYCIVDASRAAIIPDTMSYEQVRTLQALFDAMLILGCPNELCWGDCLLGHQKGWSQAGGCELCPSDQKYIR